MGKIVYGKMKATKCVRQDCKYFVPEDVAFCCGGCRDRVWENDDIKHDEDCQRRKSNAPFLNEPMEVD